MSSNQGRTVPPIVLWITGLAVIGFCVAGIGALVAWMPNSPGGSRASVMAGTSNAAKPARAAAAARATPVRPASRRVIGTACEQCGEIEFMREVESSFQLTIRFDDGASTVIAQQESPAWRTGDRVKLVDGVMQPDP